mgnify:CR=1 FL=1
MLNGFSESVIFWMALNKRDQAMGRARTQRASSILAENLYTLSSISEVEHIKFSFWDIHEFYIIRIVIAQISDPTL